MNQERKPIFQKSLIPKIFFIIVSLALIITLNMLRQNQKPSKELNLSINAPAQDAKKFSQIPEIHPQEITALTLYVSDNCPYCSKVITFLNQEHLEVETKNVEANKESLKELIKLTHGKKQVPCLKLGNNHYLFESSEIIKQLKYVRVERPTLLVKKPEDTLKA